MILQVHDELVFDAVKEEVDIIKPIILKCMRSALPLPNEVPVEAEVGSNCAGSKHTNPSTPLRIRTNKQNPGCHVTQPGFIYKRLPHAAAHLVSYGHDILRKQCEEIDANYPTK